MLRMCMTRGTVIQVLDALPDEELSLDLKQPNQLITTVTAAVSLPARLKVKWLRADCLRVLDLQSPDVALTCSAWRNLVMCFGAVPGLNVLRVRLPRGPRPAHLQTPPQASSNGHVLVHGYLCCNCDGTAYQQLTQAANAGQNANFNFTVAIPDGLQVQTHTLCCGRCRYAPFLSAIVFIILP